MRTDIPYYVKSEDGAPWPGLVAFIQPISGGLRLRVEDGFSEDFPLNDDDPKAFLDDEPAGRVTLRAGPGRLTLQALSLPLWRGEVFSRWMGDPPQFDSEAALHDWLRQGMLQ